MSDAVGMMMEAASKSIAEKQAVIEDSTKKLTQNYLRDAPLEYKGFIIKGPVGIASLFRAKPVNLSYLPLMSDRAYMAGGLALPPIYIKDTPMISSYATQPTQSMYKLQSSYQAGCRRQ